jgi:thymidylate kinase
MCEDPKKVESLFLHNLFKDFSESGLGYCVLRNYDQLPFSLGGGDLDLAVLPEHMDLAAKCVADVGAEYGATILMDYKSSGHMIRLLGCHENEWWGAAVDLFPAMEYKGVAYLPAIYLIDNAKDYKGVRVANDVDASVTALIKELLANGVSRKGYFKEVATAYRADNDRVITLLDKMFSSAGVDALIQVLKHEEPSKREFARCVTELRREVVRRGWISKLPDRLGNLWRRLTRVIVPPGRAVAVMGTDGSGKTTLINAMMPVLGEVTHNELQYKHLRPGLLPALSAVTKGKSSCEDETVARPHEKKPSGWMMSLVRLMYYATDYYLGYWVKVYPNLMKRAHICIFDRYYYDFLIDPRRMRISLPRWIVAAVFKLAPQPSLVLCLGGEPETIYQRKPETSLDEVTRQVENLKAFSMENDRAVWIDTTNSVSKSADQSLTAIQRINL